MKPSKLLLFSVLSLIFLMTSCSKDSNSAEPPPPPPPYVIGDWKLVLQADSMFNTPPTGFLTPTDSADFYGSIKFESDGTVYTSQSFTVAPLPVGTTIFWTTNLASPTVITDTSKYTIKNNVITITPKYESSYKDTIVAVNNNKLVLLHPVSRLYKTTRYYTK